MASKSARIVFTAPEVEKNHWQEVADERYEGNLSRLLKTAMRAYLANSNGGGGQLIARRHVKILGNVFEMGDQIPSDVWKNVPPRNQEAMKNMNFVVYEDSKRGQHILDIADAQ